MIPFDEAVISAMKKVAPSVVNIANVMLFQDAYYHVIPVKGVGSGIIIDKRGYILTNAHVVERASELVVTLDDGRKLHGKIAGIDPRTDVAVIKVPGKGGFPVPQLGDSDKLNVGQMAIAIGNPFGLAGGPTVTTGVISAINRSLQTEEGFMESLIQTDAAINPGNSGGPLLDSSGVVVAINTAIIPFAQGIGFAIPINTAKRIAGDLIAHGEVIRPWLGISGLDIDQKVVAYYGLPVKKGILVVRVVGRSPAGRVGISEGDVVLKLGNARIEGMRDLMHEIDKRKAGDIVRLELLRGSKKFTVDVKLGKVTSEMLGGY